MSEWRAMGLNIVDMTLIIGYLAPVMSIEAARQWRDQFQLVSPYVLWDPNELMFPVTSQGTPTFTVVDPRTMKVVGIQEGFSPDAPPEPLIALAQCNAAGGAWDPFSQTCI